MNDGSSRRYTSFMIRMWRDPGRPEENAPEAVWVGEVEFIQSGQIVPFRGVEALLSVMMAHLEEQLQ